jgi:hypothetical protein
VTTGRHPAQTGRLFLQNVIAVIWDFDKTLLPTYMQKPLFSRYDVVEADFWDEVQKLPAYYSERGHPLVATDTIYLSHILTYVRAGVFDGLNNRILGELGAELEFYPGIPDIFAELKALVDSNERYQRHDITLEHYVVSTGLRQIILGTSVAECADDVWACEFLETTAPPGYLKENDEPTDPDTPPRLTEIAYAIDNTTKTRAIFEINKGVNKHREISVNDTHGRGAPARSLREHGLHR